MTGARTRSPMPSCPSGWPQLSSGLQALGVRPEERVAARHLRPPRDRDHVPGAAAHGAVAVPVSTMYNGTELGELLRDTRARVVVATSEFVAATREAMSLAPEATTLVLVGEPGPGQAGRGRLQPGGGREAGARSWADVLAEGQRAGARRPYGTWFDSPASGSTRRARPAPRRPRCTGTAASPGSARPTPTRCWASPRTTGATPWRSCFSRTASGTRCSSRSRSAPPRS